MEESSLENLTLKTAFLVAVTSGRRGSEIHAVDCRKEWLVISNQRAILRTNPLFRPKIASVKNINANISSKPSFLILGMLIKLSYIPWMWLGLLTIIWKRPNPLGPLLSFSCLIRKARREFLSLKILLLGGSSNVFLEPILQRIRPPLLGSKLIPPGQ
jgi:hypothetical protein